MDILCFGQQNWDWCWTGKQQLMSRLAQRGHRVLYLDPDWRPAGEWPPEPGLDARFGLRHEGPEKLWVHTPLVRRALGYRASLRLNDLLLPRIAARLGLRKPVACALHPGVLPRLDRLDSCGLVYYAVDEMSAFGGMSEEQRALIRSQEETLLRRADRALAVSPRLTQRFATVNPASFLLENGADRDHFAPDALERRSSLPEVAALPRPLLGFVGQLDERLDQELLLGLAERRPDWTIVLVGRAKAGVDFSALQRAPNIRLLGYRAYEALPAIARDVDLWLVPYRRNELTQACNPLKVFEYLATGKPVVSMPLDGLGASREALLLAEDADGFAQAVERALADPAAGRAERLAVAERNDWEARVDALEEHLAAARESAAARAGRPLSAQLLGRPRVVARGSALGPEVDEYGAWAGRRPPDRLRAATARALQAVGRARRGPVRRILIARRARLGDLIVLTPMLRALRRRLPEARIVLGLQPGAGGADLLRDSGLIDEVTTLDFVWSDDRRHQLRSLAALAGQRYDLVFSGASWFLLPEALFAPARRHLGLYDGEPWQRLGGRLVPRDLERHEADNNLALVEALTGEPETDRAPRLDLPAERLPAIEPLLEELGVAPGARFVLVHPGANRESRRWPAERFAAALAPVLEADEALHVVASGTPDEAPVVREVADALPPGLRTRFHDACGRTGLTALIALLDRAAAALTNDTGTMHLARARGTPQVALFGPENHRLWGPHPDAPAPAAVLRTVVPCAPCARLSCAAHYCLRSLEPAEVAAQLAALLARGPEAREPGLRQIVRRRRWRDLAQAGFELPLVSVVLDEAEAVEPALELLAAQDYPRLELVVPAAGPPTPDRRDVRAQAALPLRQAAPAASGTLARWRAVLAVAGGELLLRYDARQLRHRGFVGGEVAAAQRSPDSLAFEAGRPADPRRDPFGPGFTTLRRTAVEARLQPPARRPQPARAAASAAGRAAARLLRPTGPAERSR